MTIVSDIFERNKASVYSIFPVTARNFEGDILRDLRRGQDVTIIWVQASRLGPLLVAPEIVEQTRRFFFKT